MAGHRRARCRDLTAVTVAAPALIWPVILAVTVSAARITFTMRNLRPVLTR